VGYVSSPPSVCG
jgi:aspartate/tyrosine/aromatic aminotransferase